MAAGQGYIEFATGDVLTAAAANGYLASQVVMVFADSAARSAAITSPQEGMISYLKDTNATQYYSGSAWVTIGGSASPLTTKGDLYTYSTADARLGVGTNGQVLTADSTAATGLKWATATATSGLTLVHTETLSAVSSVNIDSKFTSTYTNYLVQANIEQSTANTVIVQYRAAGSTIASGYKSTFYYTEYTNNTWNVTSSASDTKLFSVSYTTDRNFINMVIADPETSEFTKAQALSTDNTYNVGYNSVYPQTTSIDGLRFAASTGNMTGTIRIYGYQNS